MPNQFFVNKFADADLLALREAVHDEIQRREDARKRKRREWIEAYASMAYHTASYEVVGETVVLATFRNGSIHMAKATPIDGDVFDEDTGIAVAYAKALGHRVPNFI